MKKLVIKISNENTIQCLPNGEQIKDKEIYSNGVLCSYCLKLIKGKEITKDHVIYRKSVNTSTPFNIVPCCRKCNNKKGSKSLLEFLGLI